MQSFDPRKTRTKALLAGLLGATAIGAVSLVFLLKARRTPTPAPTPVHAPTPPGPSHSEVAAAVAAYQVDTTGWVAYEDKETGIRFMHPPGTDVEKAGLFDSELPLLKPKPVFTVSIQGITVDEAARVRLGVPEYPFATNGLGINLVLMVYRARGLQSSKLVAIPSDKIGLETRIQNLSGTDYTHAEYSSYGFYQPHASDPGPIGYVRELVGSPKPGVVVFFREKLEHPEEHQDTTGATPLFFEMSQAMSDKFLTAIASTLTVR